MKKRVKSSLLAFCLLAVCFVGMGNEGCRTLCRDVLGCGTVRNECEAAARAANPPGEALKAALAQCRAEYEECTAFCKQFPQDPDIPTETR